MANVKLQIVYKYKCLLQCTVAWYLLIELHVYVISVFVFRPMPLRVDSHSHLTPPENMRSVSIATLVPGLQVDNW